MVSPESSLCAKVGDFFCCYKLPNTRTNRDGKTETMGRDSLTCPKFWRAIVAECLALVLFIPLATGSAVQWKPPNHPNTTQIALANGLMIATLIQCFAHVSGAHFNPSVTIPLAWNRDISILRAVLYIISQCVGATIGGLFLKQVTPADVRSPSIGCTLLGEGVTPLQGVLVEGIITFQLVFVVFATIDPSRKDVQGSAALAIGLSVATALLYSIPYTGGSMNPARSFGPALATNTWKDHWVYWVGPITAGMCAGNLYSFIFANDASRGKLLHWLSCKDKQQNKVAGKQNDVITTELEQKEAAV